MDRNKFYGNVGNVDKATTYLEGLQSQEKPMKVVWIYKDDEANYVADGCSVSDVQITGAQKPHVSVEDVVEELKAAMRDSLDPPVNYAHRYGALSGHVQGIIKKLGGEG